MRISDWSSDVCSSDLVRLLAYSRAAGLRATYRTTDATTAGQARLLTRSAIAATMAAGAETSGSAINTHAFCSGISPITRMNPSTPARPGSQSAARPHQIGRASCRETVCKSVLIQVVGVVLKKKKLDNTATLQL